MNLLREIQDRLGVSYLFIAHDLAVVKYVSTRIGVMYLGKLVETAPSDELYAHPLHPYTQVLLNNALPAHPDDAREEVILRGEVPSAFNPPAGCRFHPRCPHAMPVCAEVEPTLREEASRPPGGLPPLRRVRRALLVVVALALLAGPFDAGAQTAIRLVRVGFLSASSAANDQMRPAFVEGLREHGYIEGQNLVLESRYVEGRFERLPGLAAELVRLKCDVIVAAVTQASLAARDATATIPIVMIGVADPVGAGLVASLARPGGNVTGTSGAFTQIVGKQMELLQGDVSRRAALRRAVESGQPGLSGASAPGSADRRPYAPSRAPAARGAQSRGSRAGLRVHPSRRPLLVQGDPLFNAHRRRIAELAAGPARPDRHGRERLCRCRRAAGLRAELRRPGAALGDLRGQDSQGRATPPSCR